MEATFYFHQRSSSKWYGYLRPCQTAITGRCRRESLTTLSVAIPIVCYKSFPPLGAGYARSGTCDQPVDRRLLLGKIPMRCPRMQSFSEPLRCTSRVLPTFRLASLRLLYLHPMYSGPIVGARGFTIDQNMYVKHSLEVTVDACALDRNRLVNAQYHSFSLTALTKF